MRQAITTPTGAERRLGRDEFIVSKTDVKGVITYANDVFCRFAGMSEADLIGAPHNVIRHPDMPRAVFKLLWDMLAARQEVFAYVKNLGADGVAYWVFAHVTPTYDRAGQVIGYHSNRRAPHPAAVEAVGPLYARLRQIEAGHASARDGLDASTRAMADLLASSGTSYDEFVWSVTP